MEKDTLVRGGVLLIIIIALVAYILLRPAAVKAPATGDAGQQGGARAIDFLTSDSYTEHAPYYDIEAYYASSTPLQGATNAAAVAQMKDFVGGVISQFLIDGDFDHLTSEDIKTMGFDQGRKESLKIVFLISSSARTVSYVFTVYADTLGAHGNTDFKTFTFNTASGASLTLADLFLPGTNYLATLSKLARAKLPAIIGENHNPSTITSGTEPSAENFKNFFFDNRDLVIVFPPYAVASYAEGPQTLRIPVSELASILKSEYR